MVSICVEKLVKKYKNGVQALDGLSLTVNEGEIFSLLGQNGAGKSTLIKVLTTYLYPTSGSVIMLGKDIYHEAAAIRPHISCVAQNTSIDMYLSVTENMMFQSKLYEVNRWLLDHDIPFLGIEIIQPTLEDVFIRLTGENGRKVC